MTHATHATTGLVGDVGGERTRTFFGQLAAVHQVVVALILRETRTRFGNSGFGFLWSLLEPLLFVGGVVVIRSAIRDSTPFGESLVLFLATGLLLFRVFVGVSNGMGNSITSNRALLAYPPVKPTDVLVARGILDVMVMCFVIVVFFLALAWISDTKVVADVPSLLGGVGAVMLLGVGVGTFNAVVMVIVPTWRLIYGVLRLPLLVTSGAFYVPLSMPPEIRAVIWWNPVLHCVEWLRTGVYLTYNPMLSVTYVIGLSCALLLAGLALERLYRFKLLVK